MAPRANWKGVLRIENRSWQVALYTTASTSDRICVWIGEKMVVEAPLLLAGRCWIRHSGRPRSMNDQQLSDAEFLIRQAVCSAKRGEYRIRRRLKLIAQKLKKAETEGEA